MVYSDDSRELSSPIHRTEEKFAVEEVKQENRSTKPTARLNRLAALASEINNWEDDLSHPTVVNIIVCAKLKKVLNKKFLHN